LARYKDWSCGDILAELDANARSVDASSGKNPFYIVPVVPHTQMHDGHFDIEMGTVVMAMLIMGSKTYLLAR
jgi:hypothetical protein